MGTLRFNPLSISETDNYVLVHFLGKPQSRNLK